MKTIPTMKPLSTWSRIGIGLALVLSWFVFTAMKEGAK